MLFTTTELISFHFIQFWKCVCSSQASVILSYKCCLLFLVPILHIQFHACDMSGNRENNFYEDGILSMHACACACVHTCTHTNLIGNIVCFLLRNSLGSEFYMPTFCLFHLHRQIPNPPVKVEQMECYETSAYKIQTPGNYPEESIQHSEHDESWKSRIIGNESCGYCNSL
jgi:hypothetical protein